jgi:hypothetical protein
MGGQARTTPAPSVRARRCCRSTNPLLLCSQSACHAARTGVVTVWCVCGRHQAPGAPIRCTSSACWDGVDGPVPLGAQDLPKAHHPLTRAPQTTCGSAVVLER